MSSPFRRRQQMIRAAMSGAVTIAATAALAAPDPSSASGQEYAGLLVLLHENLRKLSDIASHEARIPVKMEMAKEFGPWVKGVLEASETSPATQDEIVMTMMIWSVDCGDVEAALAIGAHAIRHGLVMPAPFTRTPAAFLVEQIADNVLADPNFAQLSELHSLNDMTEAADMHDNIRAKLVKVIGRAYADRVDNFDPADDNAPAGGKAAFATAALDNFERAKKLDPSAGVKKDIERMQRILKNEAEQPATDPDRAIDPAPDTKTD
jgi:hypothetical protein